MAMADVHKYMKARQKAYDSNNLPEAASLCNNIGVYYSEKGEHEKALRYHREELQLTSSLQDRLGQAIAHRKIGECLADMDQFTKAMEEQEAYLKLAKSLNNLQEIQRAHATIGRIWYLKYKGDDDQQQHVTSGKRSLDKSRESYMSSLRVCDELEKEGSLMVRELSDMRARVYLNLGLLAEETKDLRMAEQHYQRACIIGKECGVNDSLIWQCYFNHGELLLELDQANKALIVFEESLQYCKKCNQNKSLSLLQMAVINVNMSAWTTAKKYLKTCLKLNSVPDDEQYQCIVKKYLAVCEIMKLLTKIESCSVHEEKIQLLELVGDICCRKRVSFYSTAIEYYCKQLELAEIHGADSSRLSSILFSIAVTYADKGVYDKALEYHQKKLALWEDSNPTEVASCLCDIARIYELTNKDWTVVMETYNRAISLVRQSNDPKSKRDVYRASLVFLEDCPALGARKEKESIEKDLRLLYTNHPHLMTDSQSESCSETEEAEEQLVLSCSSSSEDEEDGILSRDGPGGRQLRGVALRKRSQLNKRNEKGETLLHVATIDGNKKKVQQLIEDGSTVRTRDYCGWTPLHEACNHGYTEIVELLVENGADINDPGGVHCHQTTPIMDAAINGHVDIVKYLISKHADLARKNDEGKTVLGMIQSLCEDSTSGKKCPLLKEHKEIKALLMNELKGKGSSSANPLMLSGRSSPPVAIVHPMQSSQSIPALIAEDDNDDEWAVSEADGNLLPVEDEWLINDIPQPMKKRRKLSLSNSSRPSKKPTERRELSERREPSNRRESTERSREGRKSSAKKKQTESINRTESIIRIEVDDDQCPTDDNYHMDYSTTTDPPTQYPPITATPSIITHNTIRLKVRIEGVTYLVPCERCNENNQFVTVSSLIDKAIDRYMMQTGRKPILSLTNSEGAFLCPTDNVVDVVQDGEVLVGVVSRWETPALADHYQSVCEKLNTDVNHSVLGVLNSNTNPISLDLSNCGLTPSSSPALLQSLIPQSSITCLNLTGNRLRDSTMIELASLLKALTNLFTLNISCTNISLNGITSLSQCLKSFTNDRRHLVLRELNLSHNSLGPHCGSALASLLSLCPYLTVLDLCDIGLIPYSFQAHTGLLDGLTSLPYLQSLSLSRNDIGIEGLRALAPVITKSLTSLNIGYTTSSPLSFSDIFPLAMSTGLITALDLSGCDLRNVSLFHETSLSHQQLKELCLCMTGLTINSINNLSRYFQFCSLLRSLNVSGNPDLGNNGVIELLSSVRPCETLLVRNCGLQTPVPRQLYISNRLIHLDLSDNNGITDDDRTTIASSWSIDNVISCGNIFVLKH